MSSMSEKEIGELVEAALTTKPAEWIESPATTLEDAVGYWLFNALLGGTWVEHRCAVADPHDCSASSPWELALHDLYNDEVGQLRDDAEKMLRERITDLVRRFATEYPDAPREQQPLAALDKRMREVGCYD